MCQALRARGVDAPVLFLTARDALTDRLAGFSAGGDDYLTKPFALRRARCAAARAAAAQRGRRRRRGRRRCVLDPVTHAMRRGDAEVSLTPTEFRLLAALAAQPGGSCAAASSSRAAWPDGAIVHDNTLDQYVARLRRKLREVGAPVAIETVHGVGYRLRMNRFRTLRGRLTAAVAAGDRRRRRDRGARVQRDPEREPERRRRQLVCARRPPPRRPRSTSAATGVLHVREAPDDAAVDATGLGLRRPAPGAGAAAHRGGAARPRTSLPAAAASSPTLEDRRRGSTRCR